LNLIEGFETTSMDFTDVMHTKRKMISPFGHILKPLIVGVKRPGLAKSEPGFPWWLLNSVIRRSGRPMHPGILKTISYILILIILFSTHCMAGNIQEQKDAMDCGYFMCQYEKENIDKIIIENAKECQTLMFGEIHDSVLVGSLPTIEDSNYVISLLPEIRRIGYKYLALEVDSVAKKKGHSNDIVRFCKEYNQGNDIHDKEYLYAKPGWIELIKRAIDLGYIIKFIDIPESSGCGSFLRDKEMFEKMKKEIFEKDENTKVVVYIGANHVIECETYEGIYFHKGKRKPLGFFLNDYTKGKNYSVYMGYPDDTPMGCDLIISNFIWDTFKKIH
jgi:hypothetical protein